MNDSMNYNKEKSIIIKKVKNDFVIKIDEEKILTEDLKEKKDKSYIPKNIEDVDGLEYCES